MIFQSKNKKPWDYKWKLNVNIEILESTPTVDNSKFVRYDKWLFILVPRFILGKSKIANTQNVYKQCLNLNDDEILLSCTN